MDHIPFNGQHTSLVNRQNKNNTREQLQPQEVAVSRLLFNPETYIVYEIKLPADMNAEVSSDCACLGLGWVRMSHHGA